MEQEEIKKKLEDIKDKSIQVFNAENQKKATNFVSRCFSGVYKASYMFTALLICVFLLILVGSVLYAIFHSADTNVVPSYKEYSEKNPIKVESKVDSTSVDINKNFGDELIKICELTGTKKTDDLVPQIAGVEEKHRKAYVRGLLKFLNDAKSGLDKDYKPEEHGQMLFKAFTEQFTERVNDLPNRKAVASAECKTAWVIALISLFCILFSLVLPLLIQIEKNTKKEKE